MPNVTVTLDENEQILLIELMRTYMEVDATDEFDDDDECEAHLADCRDLIKRIGGGE